MIWKLTIRVITPQPKILSSADTATAFSASHVRALRWWYTCQNLALLIFLSVRFCSLQYHSGFHTSWGSNMIEHPSRMRELRGSVPSVVDYPSMIQSVQYFSLPDVRFTSGDLLGKRVSDHTLSWQKLARMRFTDQGSFQFLTYRVASTEVKAFFQAFVTRENKTEHQAGGKSCTY